MSRQECGTSFQPLQTSPATAAAEAATASARRTSGQIGDDEDLLVDRRAAGLDPPHSLGEVVDVGDALLEQVADALGAVAEQPHGSLGVGVGGEDEHAGARVALADLVRGADPL